jgi:hypothetical protein
MTHAWCSDTERDAAVRAAEDKRTGRLPTLREAIARPFAEAAERSSTVSKTGETQSGMRTERVVLEITREAWRRATPTSPDDWSHAAREAGIIFLPGESVSVVEEDRPGVMDVDGDRIDMSWKKLANQLKEERDKARKACDNMLALANAHGDSVKSLTSEREAAIRERDKLRGEITSVLDRSEFASKELTRLRNRVAELESQLESVADRAATAETALDARTSTAGEGSCAAPAASEWRDLDPEVGDVVEEGDEICWWNIWKPVNRGEIGIKVCQHGFSFRRRVPTPAASGGGEGEPVAWGVIECRGGPIIHATPDEEEATQYAGTVVPLYRAPPQPRGWLTEEERDLIAGITDDDEYTEEGQDIAKALLARSSPPEVKLPVLFARSNLGDRLLVETQVRQALAAAGVAVKEVE